MIAFADVYARPDLAALEAEVKRHAAALAAARRDEEAVEIASAWNQTRSRVMTSKNIAHLRYHQDTRDAAAKAENDFWNEASSLLRELDALHASALLGCAHKGAIARAFGPQLLALKECVAATFAPPIRAAIAEEARLYTRYTELTAEADIEFGGEKLNLTGLARYFVDADRTTRLAAQRARDTFLAARGEELDSLYDRLVGLRDGMGRALGLASFTPLGYRLMERTSWGPEDARVFREEIVREVVPLACQLAGRQAERLGSSRLMFWDEPVADPRGNPKPLGDAAFCVAAARRMYRELGPEFGAFMDMLADGGLLDLVNRPGKAGGGFCTDFPDLGLPFVFANFNGTEADVQVLTHECGHAFQVWQSRGQPLIEYRWPTTEAAEVHSMSMEVLTYPWMTLFFGDEEAARFRRIHIEQRILAIPYMALVDHFQDEVYARPGLAPAERHALWRELEQRYLPFRDYGGELPYLQKGTIWQRQLHIYGYPFYYLDYALAQTCALQFLEKAETDRARALADYLAICAPGGSVSFRDMCAAGRISSPFEPGCLRDTMRVVRRLLRLE